MTDPTDFEAVMGGLGDGSQTAAAEVMARTYRRIVGLVRKRIGARFRARVDADSVANSVLKTFFRRHTADPYALTDWEDIWRLLAEIARRKLSNRLRWHDRDKRRDPGERVGLEADVAGDERAADAEEQVVVDDLCDRLMAGYGEHERLAIELTVQGYSVDEVAARVGTGGRTVLRIRAKFRKHLEAALGEADE